MNSIKAIKLNQEHQLGGIDGIAALTPRAYRRPLLLLAFSRTNDKKQKHLFGQNNIDSIG